MAEKAEMIDKIHPVQLRNLLEAARARCKYGTRAYTAFDGGGDLVEPAPRDHGRGARQA